MYVCMCAHFFAYLLCHQSEESGTQVLNKSRGRTQRPKLLTAAPHPCLSSHMMRNQRAFPGPFPQNSVPLGFCVLSPISSFYTSFQTSLNFLNTVLRTMPASVVVLPNFSCKLLQVDPLSHQA